MPVVCCFPYSLISLTPSNILLSNAMGEKYNKSIFLKIDQLERYVTALHLTCRTRVWYEMRYPSDEQLTTQLNYYQTKLDNQFSFDKSGTNSTTCFHLLEKPHNKCQLYNASMLSTNKPILVHTPSISPILDQ